jgi:hypothetical protein
VVDDRKSGSTDADGDAKPQDDTPKEATVQPDVKPTDPAEEGASATSADTDADTAEDASEPLLAEHTDPSDAEDSDNVADPADHTSEPPDLTTPPEPVAQPAPEPRKGGTFGAALLGGAIAALIGFAVAESDVLDPLLPPSWQETDASAELEALSAELAQQKAAQEDISAALGAMDLPALSARIDDLAAALDPLGGQIAQIASETGDFATRLDALEKRPISEGAPQSAVDAYERELARLSDAVAEQRATVESMIEEARQLDANAAEASRAATLQTVVARLETAVGSGEPYADLLDDLTQTGAEVPQALADHAAEGVASLPALRESFPPAAREALAATRSGGSGEGIGAFLQRQLGARSVSPRSGDDPDAILSRAESALVQGRIELALTELAAMPETGRAPLEGWIARAQTRVDALNAVESLATTTPENSN